MKATSILNLDIDELEEKIKSMYRNVALDPHKPYHFEMGMGLARKLGYSPLELVDVPAAAVDSFAGVGYHFDLAAIRPGEKVLDLGSGSGMDLFIAAKKTGTHGIAFGVDMTDEQLEKARKLAAEHRFRNTSIVKAYVEELPFADGAFDVVISNGVINLSADKDRCFREVSRVLKQGGRMAISDIVTEMHLPENITCNASLWAACIGGAFQEDHYSQIIENAGMRHIQVLHNTSYKFISKSAEAASKQYGVKSVSLRADKI